MKKFFNIMTYIASALVILTACSLCVYFYPWQFVVGCLLIAIAILGFYLWKFAKIIIILEDDLGKAIEALEEVESSMQNIIDMKLYFDTPEVQQLVAHVMDSVKMSKFSVNKMIKNFTDRSKQKFIMVFEEDEGETEMAVVDQKKAKPFSQERQKALIDDAQERIMNEGTVATSVER